MHTHLASSVELMGHHLEETFSLCKIHVESAYTGCEGRVVPLLHGRRGHAVRYLWLWKNHLLAVFFVLTSSFLVGREVEAGHPNYVTHYLPNERFLNVMNDLVFISHLPLNFLWRKIIS